MEMMPYDEAMSELKRLHYYLNEQSAKLYSMVKHQKVSRSLLAYRKAVAKATAELRSDKIPATLIKDLVGGMCADEEFEWKQAQMECKTCNDLIGVAETQISGLQSQVKVK